MLLLDGKGSELRHYLEGALQRCGREKDLIIIGPRNATYNPLADESWEDVKFANEIVSAAGFLAGNTGHTRKMSDPFWDRAALDVLTAMVAMARVTLRKTSGAKLNFDHLVRLRPLLTKSDSEIKRTVADIVALLSPETGASLAEYAALPANTRQSVASCVGPVLAPFGRPPLKNVLVPQPGRPEADLNTILSEGKIVLLDVGEAEDAQELLPAAALVKSAFARMILSRRSRKVNQVRPVFGLYEEFQKIFTVQPDSSACEANFMDVCRWCGCGIILTTQAVSSLLAVAPPALVDKLISLVGTQIWLSSSDPVSAMYAARSFEMPGEESYRPAPLLFPGNDAKTTLTPNLATMQPGTMHILLRDGTTRSVRADLAAP